MRKLTATERDEQLRQARENANLYMCALQDVVTDAIDAKESSPKCPEGHYTFMLTRAASPCGGLAVVVFHYPGQRDSVTVHGAERLLRADTIGREWPAACWPALERLAVARTKAEQAAGWGARAELRVFA